METTVILEQPVVRLEAVQRYGREYTDIFASDLRAAEVGREFESGYSTTYWETLTVVYKDDNGVGALRRTCRANEFNERSDDILELVWFELHAQPPTE